MIIFSYFLFINFTSSEPYQPGNSLVVVLCNLIVNLFGNLILLFLTILFHPVRVALQHGGGFYSIDVTLILEIFKLAFVKIKFDVLSLNIFGARFLGLVASHSREKGNGLHMHFSKVFLSHGNERMLVNL